MIIMDRNFHGAKKAKRRVGIGACFCLLLCLSWVPANWARAEDGTEDYNFSWLDPDKKIYVLQNRRYRKANHFMVSVMGGAGFSNPYSNAYNLDPRIAYYFSESWGIEGFYTFTFNSPNTTLQALSQASANITPQVRNVTSQDGALVHWVPWYAKINVFNKILYFDWYLDAGAGTINTSVNTASLSTAANLVYQNFFAFYFGTGHLYHLTDNWILRLDFTGAVFSAPIYGTSGGNAWYSNYNVAAGIGLKL